MVGLVVSLRFRQVQDFIVQKVAVYLSKEWNTTVTIRSLHYKPFSQLSMRGIYVEDLDGDTLVFAGSVDAALDLRPLIRGGDFVIGDLSVSDADFSLKKYPDGSTNLSFIIDYFQGGTKTSPRKRKRSVNLKLPEVDFSNVSLRYKNLARLSKPVKGINYNDVHISHLNGSLSEIDFENHLFKSRINTVSFRESSGLFVKKLDATVVIDSNRMDFSNLFLELNNSRVTDRIEMNFDRFEDFSDFVHKVRINGNFKDSRITSDDIALFAPEVAVTQFDVWLSGRVKGTIDAISGRDMTIRAGKETWIRGDVKITGLPQINETMFEMDLDHLITNRQELEKLVAQLSGKDVFQLPEVFERLGNVDYRGHVMGFYNDFIANGIFRTKLGDVVSDINLDLKGRSTYSGEVFVQDFDLATLLENPELGRAEFRLNLSGSGFQLSELSEQVEAQIAFFDFKGYRYQNMELAGTFSDHRFDGHLAIADPHLQAEVAGSWKLKGADSQRISIQGNLSRADLNELHLYQKDTLSVSGSFLAHLTGDLPADVSGKIELADLQLYTPQKKTGVDSLFLWTGKTVNNRYVRIQSDILDGSITGQFDLTTFPDYFKALAKRYIPSWQTEIGPTGKQDFNVNVRVHDFTPIAMVLMPELKIPKTFYLNGRFSSVDNVNSLNGYIETLEYKGMVVDHIILDQAAYDESLNVFLTADRLNITDSLHIRNINISNVLRNDSLHFNIKLSNQEDPNQLDLNGLVEFDENAAARLSLLPSDVVINHADWRLQEKVKFDFEEEKTLLNGFELSNDSQIIRLDGAISNSEEDVLNLTFEHFSLSTFNSLAGQLGVELSGEMNGVMEIRSILKHPYVQSDIQTTDMYYNETLIGDMDLQAALDQTTKLVNLTAEITKQGRPTLQLDGTYDASLKEDNLDLRLKMQDNELIVFQPFLSNLISDLSGTATASFRVRGSVFQPVIDGFAHLKNANFVVNYLQTRYTINDEIDVNNSVIQLNDVVIEDINGEQAIASGRVDMKKPNTPEIHVNINAENFMVLNTTAKDNPVYYGTAFGSGVFAFNGPTNDIDIRIAATTSEGTVFNIPLNSVGTLTDQDFITFVSKDTAQVEVRPHAFQGLTMTLDLNVTNEARANIYTDLGRLSGNGTGLLSMNITSMGDFEMFGDYVIATGEFEFTAQDYINKIFEINRGGTIRWTGNPTEALINLTAVYEVRTSIAPLYTAAGRGSNDARVQAQAEMILNGSLLHPDISFGINFPSDSYIKDELQSYFSDANNINQQALSLIVRRSFAPGTGTNLTRELNTTVLSAGTELAFNQLNNIISQSLNLNFVDFNIRSLNEASASIRLLNDRLILTGGVTDRRGQLNDFNVFGKEVASDVEAIYLIRKSGNLLLRASNRLSNRNFLNPTDEYVSALGLVYRQEFDTFDEFFTRMFRFRRERSEQDSTGSTSSVPDTISEETESDSIYFKNVD